MTPKRLRSLVDEFVQFQSRAENFPSDEQSGRTDRRVTPDVDPVSLPGRWLLETLGQSMVAVLLGYRSVRPTERYLRVIDTRTLEEMQEWDGRIARGWVRRSIESLEGTQREYAERVLSGDIEWSPPVWSELLVTIGEIKFDYWGPAPVNFNARLQRVMAAFVPARAVALDLGRPAAFSFMTGSNRWLGGRSPIAHLAATGARDVEDVLQAADQYLAAR